MKIEKIVAGIDQTKHAEVVLSTAIELAKKYNAQLHVVQAVHVPVDMPVEALSIDPESLPNKLLTHGKMILSRQLSEMLIENKDVISSSEARLGTAWQVICDVAEENSANLVVIGTHSRSLFERIVGTTAAKVVNHAHCSVFLVRV